MGARILLACWGSYGDLFPTLGLALELKSRGHRPLVATCAYYRPLVEGLGLDFHPVPPDIDPDDRALIARLMDRRRGTEYIVRELLMPGLRAAHGALHAAAEGADLIVSHPVTFAAPIVAAQRGIRWVSTVLAPISFFSAYDLPALPPFPASAHLTRLGPGICRAVISLARSITRPWLAPVLALRQEMGVAESGHPLFEGQFSPLLTLAMFPGVLAQPQPDWPVNVVRTGFVSYNGPEPLPAELGAFLDAGEPPVTFTLGSSAVGAAGTFFVEAARAAALAGWRAVLLVGRDPANRPAAPLPPGIIAVEYAPHRELFPRSAAIVHQGGIGTTSQALRAGKPQLVVPHAHDQPDNANRVIRLGVARVTSPGRFRAEHVAGHLQALLGQEHHGTRAGAIGRTVAGEGDGATCASDALEAALSK